MGGLPAPASRLEEAALDGIPVIAVDPKGDLGNLLLTFSALDPGDFRPWVNDDDARRKGLTPEQGVMLASSVGPSLDL